MKRVLVVVFLLLASCSTDHGTAYPTCIQNREWSDVQQMNMAADLHALPPDSTLIPAMLDYYRMRSQARACGG